MSNGACANPGPNLLPPLVDGFLQNPYLRMWPERYNALALAQLETLRRANSYRMRQYDAPQDKQAVIQPYDTWEGQIRCAVESWWWGTSFVAFSSEEGDLGASVDPNHNFLIRIRENCNNVGAMSDFVYAKTYSIFGSLFVPVLNSSPRPLPEGLLNVEIHNPTATARKCQLVFWIAEKCQIPESMLTECTNLGDSPCR